MKIYTIGFTKKNAQQFFSRLRQPGLVRVVDVRLNNVSQLAGFAKKDDLRFFLQEINKIEYIHLPLLAPTQAILDSYKKKGGDWQSYEREFLNLMAQRKVEEAVSKQIMEGACLLCSEDKPQHCHRRLVAEYLLNQWGYVEIIHL